MTTPHHPRAARQRRALSSVGGSVEARGEPGTCDRLRSVLAADLDPDQARAHVHGFHSYPARLHPLIARRCIELFSPPGGTVLDPFCGSGTVLVESVLAGRRSIGTDLNPLAVAIAALKSRGLGPNQASALVQSALQVEKHAEARRKARAGSTQSYPQADTSQFEPHVLLELDGIRDGIRALRGGFVKDTLWIVLSSILTKVSRKQGDTGSLVEGPRRLASGYTIRLFRRKTEELGQRLQAFHALAPRNAHVPHVACLDARDLHELPADPVDLILTSPPYPGTYDYLEHHGTRLRWLGLPAQPLDEREIGSRRKLERLGFADACRAFQRDMTEVLRSCARILRPNGLVVLVIGDGLVSGRATHTDQMIESCARLAGLQWDATASQPRPQFHPSGDQAFRGHPKKEHFVVLHKPETNLPSR